MKPGKTLTHLLEMDKPKLEKLVVKWRKSKPIQVVIFVHAASDPIPENLMVAIKDAMNPDEEGQPRMSSLITVHYGSCSVMALHYLLVAVLYMYHLQYRVL